MNRTEALDAAKAAVTNRPNAYGPPEQNFARIAALWSAYLVGKAPGTDAAQPVTAIDVAAMMALMKIARIEETPSHADSWVDLAGYAACGAEVSAGPGNDDGWAALDGGWPTPRLKVGDELRAPGWIGVIDWVEPEPYGGHFPYRAGNRADGAFWPSADEVSHYRRT
jgi:hypothetical protein